MLTSNELTEEYGFERNLFELSYTEPIGQISDELLNYANQSFRGGEGYTGIAANIQYYMGFNVSIPSGDDFKIRTTYYYPIWL